MDLVRHFLGRSRCSRLIFALINGLIRDWWRRSHLRGRCHWTVHYRLRCRHFGKTRSWLCNVIRITHIADVWEDGGRIWLLRLHHMVLLLLYWSIRLLICYICISWLQIFAEDHIITLGLSRCCIEVSVLVKTTLSSSKVIWTWRWRLTEGAGRHLGTAWSI